MSDDDEVEEVMFKYAGQESVPSDVTHVQFLPRVVDVSNGTFSYCSSLMKVVLNEGLREIRECAFSDCTSLQSINIPSTVTKIDGAAFMHCKSLVEVVLNDGLTEIGDNAFLDCIALQSIVIPSTVKEISMAAFSGCTGLGKVILNDGIKKIGDSAFRECSSLQSITIPSTVDEIDKLAFYYCNNLRTVVMNDGINIIKKQAFHSCKSLQSITIPSTVTEIGECAFWDCTNLGHVVLNVGIERIFYGVFGGCSSLESITLPSTVTEIGQNAFWNCTSLSEVVINNEEIQLGDKAFSRLVHFERSSLERFKFPRLSTRLNNVVEAGQRDIEPNMDDIPLVEWRGGELIIPTVQRQIQSPYAMEITEVDKEKLNKVKGLISYYELKEATTMFELALWKARIDQAEDANDVNREACRIEVPGPVKNAVLAYLS